MNLSTTCVAAAVMAVGAGAARADEAVVVHGPAKAVAEIIAAEHEYSAKFEAQGMAAGFRDFLDPTDGIAFMGGAQPLKREALIKALGADDGERLSWTPREIFAAKSGDFGASWGRFRSMAGGKTVATGSYVTVWRKAVDGHWRALMDIGQPDPAKSSH